jgi:hypothetical protein
MRHVQRNPIIITLILTMALPLSASMAEERVEFEFFWGFSVGYTQTEIDIMCENFIPINYMCMGFQLTATGDLTAQIADLNVLPGSRAGFISNWYLDFGSAAGYDTAFIMSQALPGEFVWEGTLQPFFTLSIDYSCPCSYEGGICIDTFTVFPGPDNWLWVNDQTSDSIKPIFNNNQGPFCAELEMLPCGIIFFTEVPENDELIGRYCEGVSFQFEAITGMEPYSQVYGYSFCSPVPEGTSITNEGLFTLPPNNEGVYEITIKAFGDCPNFGIYTFNVILEDHELCGDPNCDGYVNVSDAVRIINYIFIGGPAPSPMEAGDANCDSTCNVSDAVWIINYVFIGGNEPGDIDGDGVPDC